MEAFLGVRAEGSKILLKPDGVHGSGKGRIYVADSATRKLERERAPLRPLSGKVSRPEAWQNTAEVRP